MAGLDDIDFSEGMTRPQSPFGAGARNRDNEARVRKARQPLQKKIIEPARRNAPTSFEESISQLSKALRGRS